MTTTHTYDLLPLFDSRQSFYAKARVVRHLDSGKLELFSYNTLVAQIDGDEAKVFGTHSATTLRHIKDFLKQDGFKAETKKQI